MSMTEEERERKDNMAELHLTVDPGMTLVDNAVNECINGIEEQWAEYLDGEGLTLIAYEGVSEARVRFHLYKAVAKQLVVHANSEACNAELRGDDDEQPETMGGDV